MLQSILFLQIPQSGLKDSLCGSRLMEALGGARGFLREKPSLSVALTVQAGEEAGNERCNPCLPGAYNQVGETGVKITPKPKNLITKCHQWCREKSKELWKNRKIRPNAGGQGTSLQASLGEEVALMGPAGKGGGGNS